jgi:hypothetical protein
MPLRPSLINNSIKQKKLKLLKGTKCRSKRGNHVEKKDKLDSLESLLKPHDTPLKDTGTFGEITVSFLTEHGESTFYISEVLGRY